MNNNSKFYFIYYYYILDKEKAMSLTSAVYNIK